MSNKEWTLIHTAQSYDEAKDFAKSRINGCQYRRSDLNSQTEYSFKCSEYRKYPLCSFKIKIIVPDNNMHCVTIMSRNLHEHEKNERNPTTRVPSPIRKTVSDHVKFGLSQSQIKASLVTNYPQYSINQDKLHNLIVYERRKDRPEIFSIHDLRNWCNEHREAKELHSTFVPFYNAVDINNIFIFFTTKQLFQQIQLTTYLQVDATYKVTWNNLPLLVFGSTDANRHFKPFGMALISEDENTECYVKLFDSIKTLAVQLNVQCFINQVMSDGAQGIVLIFNYIVFKDDFHYLAITSAQEMLFSNSRRLTCWSHMIRRCRKHRNLVTKNDWQIID